MGNSHRRPLKTGENRCYFLGSAQLGLVSSLAASFLLFSIAFGMAFCHGAPARPFLSPYLSFLGLFWMTAPLAWLYAIPYERFLSPVHAVEANLYTLGLVAAWRVALIVRTLMVTMGYHPIAALCLVMTFADVVVLWLMQFLPVPLFEVMGGARLSEADQVRRGLARMIVVGGVCSFPVWLVGALALSYVGKPSWRVVEPNPAERVRSSVALQVLAWFSVAFWGLVLPFTQPEQQLRRQVEQAFAAGRITPALAEMSAHNPGDFPPHWDPPPRQANMQVLDIWDGIEKGTAAPWVRDVYRRKLVDLLWHGWILSDEELARFGALLGRLPEGPGIVDELMNGEDTYVTKKLRPYLTQPKEGTEPK
jgi:hypothetical protein